MGQPVAWRAFGGGIVGLSGICIVFRQDLAAFTATRGLIGLLIALAGAYLASAGNVVGARNARKGVPVTQANTFGMGYGGLLTLCIHFAMGGTFTMEWSVGYLGPMLYLTIFGSIVAFVRIVKTNAIIFFDCGGYRAEQLHVILLHLN